MIIVGSTSPAFSAKAIVQGEIKTVTEKDFANRYVLFFFYALDFSFVCPSEMHALQENLAEFGKREVEVVGISVDTIYTHFAWLNTPRAQSGGQGITFTLIADTSQHLSKAYGVFDEREGLALRGAFVVDRNNIIQYGALNTLAFARSISELLRVVDAIQFVEKYGEVCPANWQPGHEGIKEPLIFKAA